MPRNTGSSTSLVVPGSSIGLAQLAANSVDASKIVDGSVGLAELAANSVDASKIVDGSVGLAELGANSVDASKIVDGSVGLAELGANSVNSSKVVDGSLVSADLSPTAGLLSSQLAGYGAYPLFSIAVTAVASIPITPIPQTYRHLLVVISGIRTALAAVLDGLDIRYNNDTTAAYSGGLATLAAAYSYTAPGTAAQAVLGNVSGASAPQAGAHGNHVLFVPNYTQALTMHQGQSQGMTLDNVSIPQLFVSGHFYNPASPAAITRIDLFTNSGANFSATIGGRINVYGLE